MRTATAETTDVTLLDLLDRVVDHGVVLAGDITISVADVDLIYLGLRAVLTSVERARELDLVALPGSTEGALDA